MARQTGALAVAANDLASAGGGTSAIAVAIDNGANELAILFLGGDEIALGCQEGFGVLVQARARLWLPGPRTCLRRPCIFDDRFVPGIAEAKALAPPSGRAERTASAASRAVEARRGNSPATKKDRPSSTPVIIDA